MAVEVLTFGVPSHQAQRLKILLDLHNRAATKISFCLKSSKEKNKK